MTVLATRMYSARRDPTVRPRRQWSRRRILLAALAAYVSIAFLATASTWSDPTHRLIGTGDDPQLFVWFLRWTPWAIAHGYNPLFSDHILYPSGANLMWNTSVPLLGILLWPVTVTAGPLAAYNVAVVGCFALSAFTAFLAIGKFTVRTWPAFIGGLCYGFSPYMMGQALGHLHMLFAVAPPAVVLLLNRLVTRHNLPPWRTGVPLGFLIAAQALVGEEMLAITAIGAVIALGALASFNRQKIRSEWAAFARVTAWAGIVSVVILAAPLAWQFFGPDRVHGRLFDAQTYSIDPQSLVVPTFGQALAPASVPDPLGLLSGGPAESGAFILPLLLVGILAFRRQHAPLRRGIVLPAATVTIGSVLLSLGPRLHVAGHRLGVPLPMRYLQSLPVAENLVSTRFIVVATLCAALLAAIALDGLAIASSGSRFSLVIAGAVLATMLPRVPIAQVDTSVPHYFATGAKSLPTGSVLLVLPGNTPPVNASTMLDQAVSGMDFKVVNGYAIAPLRPGETRYLRPQPTPWTQLMDSHGQGEVNDAAARRYLRAMHVDFVVADLLLVEPARMGDVTRIIGTTPNCQAGVCVWSTGHALNAILAARGDTETGR